MNCGCALLKGQVIPRSDAVKAGWDTLLARDLFKAWWSEGERVWSLCRSIAVTSRMKCKPWMTCSDVLAAVRSGWTIGLALAGERVEFWPDMEDLSLGGCCRGLLGAGATGALFARWRGRSFWQGADYFSVVLPVGHAIGRVGCFVTGCCPGRAPHPVQLYESAGLLMISVACLLLLKRVETRRVGRGTAFCGYLFCYGLLRLLLDPLRADGRPERFLGFSHQQGFAMGLMLLGVLAALMINWQRRFIGSVR